MLAQGSLRFILPPLIVSVILAALGYYYPATAIFGITLYIIWFFRDPKRVTKIDPDLLYAAADGQIKEIIPSDDELKIAIRMSPFDVHLNRAPRQGTITKIEHKPGKHSNVYFADAEKKNEQNLIVIDHEDLETQVLQITGQFARRIECWVDLEQQVDQGEKIGIIRFGSQTNMLIRPHHPQELEIIPIVELGQQVHAGITAVAKIRRKDNE